MAALPQNIGIPEVAPSATPPNDYQTERANPNTFGANVSEAEQSVGQGLSKTGQFFGQIAADNATNEFQSQSSKLLNGDPNQMVTGPDGQQQQDTGYLGLKGRAALDARPAIDQKLNDLTKKIRGGMQTADQQLEFDNNTRRYRAQYLDGKIGTHADQQANVWYAEVNKASGTLALNHIANNADSDDEYLHGKEDTRKAYVRQAQLLGGGPELVNDAIRRADQASVKTRVEAMSVKNPVQANQFLDAHKNEVGELYDNISAQLRTRVNEQTGIGAADQAVQEASAARIPSAVQPGAVPPITKAILDQELSDRVSINGAVGPAQILPATFAQYAKPGEDINNPTDNKAVAQRIIGDYSQRYNGDPDRVAVAYFSGPGNVAPAGSPTPWIRDTKDGNGKSVSSYVSDIQSRTGGQAPIASLKASAYQRAIELTKDNPEAQRVALARINSQYTAAQVAADQTAAAKKAASDDAANGYVSAIIDGKAPPDTAHRIATDPNLDWHVKDDLQKAFLANQSDADKANKAYGDGFWKAYQQITSAPNDPGHVDSVQTLLGRAGPGGDLTLAGISKLGEVFKEQKTPEGAAVTEMKKGAIAYAKHLLSFEEDYGGGMRIPDPKGMDAFNVGFIPAFYKAYESGVAAGKTPYQLLSKDSPDFIVDKIAAPYKRPPAQEMQDKMESGLKDSNGQPAKMDLTTSDGIIAAYQSGQVTKEVAEKAAIDRGYIKPKPTPTVPMATATPTYGAYMQLKERIEPFSPEGQ